MVERNLKLKNFLSRAEDDDWALARFKLDGTLASLTMGNKTQARLADDYQTEPHKLVESLWVAINKRYKA